MDRDTEHLKLLAIFHYVVAGLAALFSFFPLLYTALGVIFIIAGWHETAKPDEELPPEFLGWIFAALGSVLFAMGITMAICVLIARAPRALFLRARYCLYQMSLRSVRYDSRSLYDRCAFAGIDEGIIRARSGGGTGIASRHGSVGISCTACPKERTLRHVK